MREVDLKISMRAHMRFKYEKFLGSFGKRLSIQLLVADNCKFFHLSLRSTSKLFSCKYFFIFYFEKINE